MCRRKEEGGKECKHNGTGNMFLFFLLNVARVSSSAFLNGSVHPKIGLPVF